MKIRVCIYGGTKLTAAQIQFVAALTRNLLEKKEVVLVSGGFDHYTDKPRRTSVDSVVLKTARETLSNEEFMLRFETRIPNKDDRTNVVRFREGRVVEVHGTSQVRRFNIVKNVDVLITISGKDNTESIIELALAIDKPVLPVRFTGGDSNKVWETYGNDIVDRLKLSEEQISQLAKIPGSEKETEALAQMVAEVAKKLGNKTCVVLMPFNNDNQEAFFKNYLQPAIIESGYIDHKVGEDDLAGNIPDLFRTYLDSARVVLADITGFNHNVMYELGYAHARTLHPFIILRNSPENNSAISELPFYLKQEMIAQNTDNEEGHKKIKQAVITYLKSQLNT